jgi:hypothetical protein
VPLAWQLLQLRQRIPCRLGARLLYGLEHALMYATAMCRGTLIHRWPVPMAHKFFTCHARRIAQGDARYETESFLSSGSNGFVVVARDRTTNSKVCSRGRTRACLSYHISKGPTRGDRRLPSFVRR